ncbi:MAG TPA: hypothetical protein VGE30_01235 [Candidatus Saccharimonadales bacterium]
MITRTDKGIFKLTETKHGTKILYLNSKSYAWIFVPKIGSLLIYSTSPHKVRDVLSTGRFYIYDVDNEPHLSDQLHLELETGKEDWQGYLLPTGLPEPDNTTKLFIPTHEVITHNPAHRIRYRRGSASNYKEAPA